MQQQQLFGQKTGRRINMKRRIFIIFPLLIAGIAFFFVYRYYNKEDKTTTLTVTEKRWVEENKDLEFDFDDVFYECKKLPRPSSIHESGNQSHNESNNQSIVSKVPDWIIGKWDCDDNEVVEIRIDGFIK